MSKSIAVFAAAMAIVAFTTGSAFAGSGCGGYTTQSVSLETQTASSGSTGEQAPHTPVPETSSN